MAISDSCESEAQGISSGRQIRVGSSDDDGEVHDGKGYSTGLRVRAVSMAEEGESWSVLTIIQTASSHRLSSRGELDAYVRFGGRGSVPIRLRRSRFGFPTPILFQFRVLPN
jgi:hypothetical protein